jgi:cellulose biosynthesis protein BcsQ
LPSSTLPFLSVLPATQDLVGAELQLVERTGREAILRKTLESLQDRFDYIIVDCPPSLGLLTLNVLTAANGVLIPIQCEYYGLEGISQLLNTVRLVQQNFNPNLAINGVLLTMYDARLNLCRQVAEDAKEYFGAKVFITPIPRNVRLAEAPSFGKPILLYDAQSVGAKSYLAVAEELLRRLESSSISIQPPPRHDERTGLNGASPAAEVVLEPSDGQAGSDAQYAGGQEDPTSEPAPAVSESNHEPGSAEPLPEVTTHD